MLAIDVNDNARFLAKRGVLQSIASKLAPTTMWVFQAQFAAALLAQQQFKLKEASQVAARVG